MPLYQRQRSNLNYRLVQKREIETSSKACEGSRLRFLFRDSKEQYRGSVEAVMEQCSDSRRGT